jgi:hypothetical protein
MLWLEARHPLYLGTVELNGGSNPRKLITKTCRKTFDNLIVLVALVSLAPTQCEGFPNNAITAAGLVHRINLHCDKRCRVRSLDRSALIGD